MTIINVVGQLKVIRKLTLAVFPWVCELYHEAKQENLIDCQHCHSVFHCSIVHLQQASVKYEGIHQQLNLCLSLYKYLLEDRDPYSVKKCPSPT